MDEEVITEGGGGVRLLSLGVHHVGYEPYLNLSLMIFRRTVYEMAVCYWIAGGYTSGYGVAHTEGHGDTP